MFGPRTTSTSAGFSAGFTIMLSLMVKCSGISICGISPRVRGSVSTPVSADAAATSGDTRKICASWVPERPLKIAVEGTQRYAAGLRRLTHADAGTACALQDTSACRDDICQSAVLRQHVEYLLGAGADGQRNLRAYGLALEDGSNLHHVVVRGVGARTDTALVYLDLADLGYLLDVIRHVRHSSQRLKRGQVYGVLLVVLCVRVGGQRYPYVAAALCLEGTPWLPRRTGRSRW